MYYHPFNCSRQNSGSCSDLLLSFTPHKLLYQLLVILSPKYFSISYLSLLLSSYFLNSDIYPLLLPYCSSPLIELLAYRFFNFQTVLHNTARVTFLKYKFNQISSPSRTLEILQCFLIIYIILKVYKAPYNITPTYLSSPSAQCPSPLWSEWTQQLLYISTVCFDFLTPSCLCRSSLTKL